MLNQLFDKTVSAHSDATAIISEDRAISYFELFIYVEWMARYFQSIAVQPGQRVAILIPNSPELAISFLGLVRIGGVAVPLEVTSHEEHIRAALENAQASVIITTPPYKALLDEVLGKSGHNGTLLPKLTVAIFEEDNIVTLGGAPLSRQSLFSESNRNGKIPPRHRNHEEEGGKIRDENGRTRLREGEKIFTDHPALIQLAADKARGGRFHVRTHHDLIQEAEAMIAKVGLTAADRLLCVSSFSQTGGLGSCLIASIAASATLVMLENGDWKKILQVLAQEHVTIFASNPSLFVDLTENYPDNLPDLPSLRWCFSTGAPLPPEISESLYRKIGINIWQWAGSLDAEVLQRSYSP